MFQKFKDFFFTPKYELPSRIQELICQIRLFSGPHVMNGYTEKEIEAACLEIAASYPAPAEVTLMALRGGEAVLSRHFVERLADIGREKHTIE